MNKYYLIYVFIYLKLQKKKKKKKEKSFNDKLLLNRLNIYSIIPIENI